MNKITILLVAILPSLAMNAQEFKVSLDVEKATNAEVESEIFRQTGVSIWCEVPAFHITLHVRKIALDDLLKMIYRRRGFICKKVNETLILIKEDSSQPFTLTGWIMDKHGTGLPGATIKIKGTSKGVYADDSGFFILRNNTNNFVVIVSHTGFHPHELGIKGQREIQVQLLQKPDLETAYVNGEKKKSDTTSTEFAIPPCCAPAPRSATSIDNKTFDRSASPYILGRLLSANGALLINPNPIPEANQSSIGIRSRSTIDGRSSPLFVLGNFIYSGNPDNINPFDIKEIEILKDPTAISQYGVSTGNGIILMKMKEGNYNQSTTITAMSGLTISKKPDLMNKPQISSPDYQKIVEFLHGKHYYSSLPSYAIKPPNAIIYEKLARGAISATEAAAAFEKLNNTDSRQEAMKHLYQGSVDQQYYVSMEGGGKDHNYFISLGHNKSRLQLVGDSRARTTININNALLPGIRGLEIRYGLYYSNSFYRNNSIPINEIIYPNEALTDHNNQPAATSRSLSQLYKEENVPAGFLDWNFRPLADRSVRNNTKTHTTFLVTSAIDYKVYKGLKLNLAYRLEKETDDQLNNHSPESYFTRDIINSYSQPSLNDIIRPIPLGGISHENNTETDGNNFKASINYSYDDKHTNSSFNITAGVETRRIQSRNAKMFRYGITENGNSTIINRTERYPLSFEPAILQEIPYDDSHSDTNDYFFAEYANAALNVKHRYKGYISIRKDESNIFGVGAQQKGVPLLSAGIYWEITKESFFHSKLFNELSLRFTNGTSSNANKSYSALTAISSTGINPWGSMGSAIINPPNPLLSWEKVKTVNVGIDFIMFKNKFWGSVDYFIKEGKDLLGLSPIDPTAGVSTYRGNQASMKGSGLEIDLNGSLENKNFQWKSRLLASFVKDKVTNFDVARAAIWFYCEPQYLSPREGKPLYSLYSLPFRGLDANGDPISVVDNHISTDYDAIIRSASLDDLVYHGPAAPPLYGSFHNSFTWKRLEIGCTFNWKLGYWFRRSTINYSALFEGNSIGHQDFAKRWQQPGDERWTNIPSMQYPGNYARDAVFGYSTVTAEKGDHIRLQDVRIQYVIYKKTRGKETMPIELFIYAKDFKPLWKANDEGIDPDFPTGISTPVNITIGIKAKF